MLSAQIAKSVITVRQLNLYVKSLLEGNTRLAGCTVTGEVTNFKRHFSSGHLYFTLKDEFAAIKCVMFRSSAARMNFDIKDGAMVVCSGRVSLYEKDGAYQFYVESIIPEGLGNQLLSLEQLKQKLLKEGLFDPAKKRKLPAFPKKIAVVTSGTGAALQDMINVISRRYSLCQLILGHASVQGENAVNEMLDVLDRFYKLNDIDLLIIGRGGGSSEDLSAFNDERLARKLHGSPFPVISAVGHQTDVSVCDLVADLRAPTPSAAAELAVPDLAEVYGYMQSLASRIALNVNSALKYGEARLKAIKGRACFTRTDGLFYQKQMYIDRILEQISFSVKNLYSQKSKDFSVVAMNIDAMSPMGVIARGYAAVYSDEKSVTSVKHINKNKPLTVKMKDGSVHCNVERIDIQEK